MFYGLNCELYWLTLGSLEVFHVPSTGSLPVTPQCSMHGSAMQEILAVLLRQKATNTDTDSQAFNSLSFLKLIACKLKGVIVY